MSHSKHHTEDDEGFRNLTLQPSTLSGLASSASKRHHTREASINSAGSLSADRPAGVIKSTSSRRPRSRSRGSGDWALQNMNFYDKLKVYMKNETYRLTIETFMEAGTYESAIERAQKEEGGHLLEGVKRHQLTKFFREEREAEAEAKRLMAEQTAGRSETEWDDQDPWAPDATSAQGNSRSTAPRLVVAPPGVCEQSEPDWLDPNSGHQAWHVQEDDWTTHPADCNCIRCSSYRDQAFMG